jgi:hypothetical protein
MINRILRPLVLGAMLAAIVCLFLPIAAFAQAAPPALTPDAAAVLTWAGLGRYTAGIASLIALVGFIVAHLVPWLPVPAATSPAWWTALYAGLNWIAGNYGKALNASAPAPASVSTAPMKPAIALLLAAGLGMSLAACTPAQNAQVQTALASPAGQLFCAIQVGGGGTIVVGLINAEATAAVPGAAPVAILATGAAKAQVDADCAAAGKSAGGTGLAVSPPANPAVVPQVAVVPPATPAPVS